MVKKALEIQKSTVAQYYDNNTRRFLRFGKHNDTQNIHQALWAEGITTQAEAVNYANGLILEEMESLNTKNKRSLHIMDLGCGVGGSIAYLAKEGFPENRYTGITISEVQASLGHEMAQKREGKHSISILQGDFLQLPAGPQVDLAYAIEAFVHATDAQQFFQSISHKLNVGGRLIIIDDFRTSQKPTGDRERNFLQDFQQGWHASSLIRPELAKSLAGEVQLQLIQQKDLTPYLDIGRPRDKAIGLMIRLAGKWMRKSTYFQSLTGGYAKQQCIRRGLVAYQMLVFEKMGS